MLLEVRNVIHFVTFEEEEDFFSVLRDVEDLIKFCALLALDHALKRIRYHEETFTHHLVFLNVKVPEGDQSILFTVHTSADLIGLLWALLDVSPHFRADARDHIDVLVQVFTHRLLNLLNRLSDRHLPPKLLCTIGQLSFQAGKH